MKTDKSQIQGYLAAAGTLAIWSGFILISRMAGKSALSGYDVLALRLGTASLLLLPFLRGIPMRLWRDARLWTLAMLGGLLYGLLVYTGFKYAPAAHGAILLPGVQPLLITLLSWLLYRNRTTVARAIGLAGITVGVALAAVPYFATGSGLHSLPGDLLILCASLVWTLYTLLAKRWTFDAWVLTRAVAVLPALVFLPVYFLFLPHHLDAVPTSALLIQALYQGIGPTIIAMLLFLRAVSLLGTERTAAVIALVPVVSGLASAPLLGEPLTPWLIGGLVFVTLGAWFAARPQPFREMPSANSGLTPIRRCIEPQA